MSSSALQRLQQAIVVRGAADQLMKLAGEPPQRVDVAAPPHGIHVVQQFADFRDFGRRRVFRRKPRRHALERLAHVEQLGQILFAERAHDQAGARSRDESFGLELAQGFAHRRAADVQLIGQRVAAQPLARRQVALQDAVPQRLIDRVGGGAARCPAA